VLKLRNHSFSQVKSSGEQCLFSPEVGFFHEETETGVRGEPTLKGVVTYTLHSLAHIVCERLMVCDLLLFSVLLNLQESELLSQVCHLGPFLLLEDMAKALVDPFLILVDLLEELESLLLVF
jgi:hypothetical protein